jgi:16S rRNA (cytidine1402-2'-O)-methyltransferase
MNKQSIYKENAKVPTVGPLLSVVGTPIGNLEDISLRALRTLSEADIIFCEDTRVTKRLCERYDISTPLRRLDAHMEMQKVGEVLRFLEEGKKIALVSDAGTPGISDPGSRVVHAVREALPDVRIDAIPGASALTSLVSISGMDCTQFLFVGFSPHKKGRETFFREVLEREVPTIFYESPHRLLNALERICTIEPLRVVCVGRELTKIYEEVQRGAASEVLAWYEAHPPKGECVVIVSGKK